MKEERKNEQCFLSKKNVFLNITQYVTKKISLGINNNNVFNK